MISAVLLMFSAVSVAPFAQVTDAQPAERDVVVAEIPRAKVELRFSLEPGSEQFEYWQKAWTERLQPYWSAIFIPKDLGLEKCNRHPIYGGFRRGNGLPPYQRPIRVWPFWRMEENLVIVDIGKVPIGEWWLYLSTEEFGRSLPQSVKVKDGKANAFNVDLSTFRLPETWKVLLPELPESTLMWPLGFEQIGEMPLIQGGEAETQEGATHPEMLIDPRAHTLILYQQFYSDYEEYLNGGYFWTIDLDILRRQAQSSQGEVQIDLRDSNLKLSAILPAFGDLDDNSLVDIEPIEDDDGYLPKFPAGFHGMLVSNLECKIYGLEPGKYRLRRILSGQSEVAQEKIVEVSVVED